MLKICYGSCWLPYFASKFKRKLFVLIRFSLYDQLTNKFLVVLMWVTLKVINITTILLQVQLNVGISILNVNILVAFSL